MSLVLQGVSMPEIASMYLQAEKLLSYCTKWKYRHFQILDLPLSLVSD
jgi:uncharacterized protein YceK